MTEHKNLKRLIRERQARTRESYTTARRQLTGDEPTGVNADSEPALGTLMAVLGDPGLRCQSVQATYRVWRDNVLLWEARHADIKALQARGRSITSYSPSSGDSQPSETEVVRFWRQDDGFRYESHGGHQDGFLFIAANGLWWLRRSDMSTRSNEEDPSAPRPVVGLPFVLDPERLLGLVEFEVIGRSTVAGRATISARALRLPPAPGSPMMTLYSLGSGADHYKLEIDSERGVLLSVTATYNGQIMQTITAQMMRFDDVISPEVFTFEPHEDERSWPPCLSPHPE